MRVYSRILAAVLLATVAAASCAVDGCLQAVQDAASSIREEDCESFVKVIITPAASTTSTITNAAAGPSKRWLERHEVVDLLLGRTVSGGKPVTAKATAIPLYASLCASPTAYESACSCLGISPTTVTELTPSITQVSINAITSYVNVSSVHGNSTSTKFGNSTGVFLNTTSSGISSSLALSSSFSSSLEASTEAMSIPKVDFTLTTTSTAIGSLASHNSSTASFSNSTDALFLNSTGASPTQSGTAIATSFLSGTVGTLGVLITTTAAPFLNSTQTTVANTNTTTSTPSTPSVSDITALATLNTTASATTAPFANTTSSTAAPTATCITTSSPFAVQVGQPGGLFDGWYLRLSGDQALFNPSLAQASRFTFDETDPDGQSHLCTVGGSGLAANASALVAIVENGTDVTGGAVYFVPPTLLEDIENEEHGWYAPLECANGGPAGRTNATAGATLSCEQGGKEYWVGCGLGLDITSDGDGTAVVDGWNCTAITLSMVYSS
ncbi:hypothetical protein GGR53DRAFT_520811 [Hypoxylon sp. FL1150]|nr:hypothetical protein GGR53DRAFT_520811 [Hypoxylon sp. FL1150]